MMLRARLLRLESEKPIVFLNREDASELDVRPLERVEIKVKSQCMIAIVNLAEKMVMPGEIGLNMDVLEVIRVKEDEKIAVHPALPPESLAFIRKKLTGGTLTKKEIFSIVKDTVDRKLSDVEIAAFVTGLYNRGMTMPEVASLSESMRETGRTLHIKGKTIYDKHSIGGVPGDKTSILVVPIVAAAGLTIPKTSSRAITSPAGTADRFECIAPVELNLEEVKRVVMKTGGCLVWGGAVDLSPADDIFIRIEYPLSIDPFLLPSVMSKKKAVNAKYVVIDIPTGRENKVSTKGEFEELATSFIQLGKRLGMKVSCISTFGDQPIGHGVGPILEAREALETLSKGKGPSDLIDKACTLAGGIFEFAGKGDGKKKAMEILQSGKAHKKLREIIEAQGGDPDIKHSDLLPGSYCAHFKSTGSGKILWVSNSPIVKICKEAGAPKDKEAGVYVRKKLGDTVKKGETLFEIYAKSQGKLERAVTLANAADVFVVGKESSIALERMPRRKTEEKYFILER